jgi:hypothetical protein
MEQGVQSLSVPIDDIQELIDFSEFPAESFLLAREKRFCPFQQFLAEGSLDIDAPEDKIEAYLMSGFRV